MNFLSEFSSRSLQFEAKWNCVISQVKWENKLVVVAGHCKESSDTVKGLLQKDTFLKSITGLFCTYEL